MRIDRHDKTSKVARWLRLGSYLCLIVVGSVWWLAHQAHAEVAERALQVGHELQRIHPAKAGITPMRINGQLLSLSSLVVPHPVAEVLDRFSARCGRDSAGVEEELQTLQQKGAKLPAELSPSVFGVFRSDDDEREGTAACFARSGAGGLQRLAGAMTRAAESGDLAELGQLRYVFARRAQDPNHTHVISVWSQGPLRVAEMFPENGDVPGSDIMPNVRPPAAQRVLASEALNAPYQLALYESSARPDQVLTSYDGQLKKHGYAAVARDALSDKLPVTARIYMREHGAALVVLALPSDGKTLVAALRPGIEGQVTLEQ
jgi:hypothetical protein